MSPDVLAAAGDLGAALDVFMTGGHNKTMGYVPLGHGQGWIEIRLPWRADLVDEEGGERIARGAIFSLLDTTGSMTTWARLGRFAPSPTLDFRVDFLRDPAPRKDLIARVECHSTNDHFAFTRGTVHEGDPEDPVAQCNGVFMFVDLKP